MPGSVCVCKHPFTSHSKKCNECECPLNRAGQSTYLSRKMVPYGPKGFAFYDPNIEEPPTLTPAITKESLCSINS